MAIYVDQPEPDSTVSTTFCASGYFDSPQEVVRRTSGSLYVRCKITYSTGNPHTAGPEEIGDPFAGTWQVQVENAPEGAGGFYAYLEDSVGTIIEQVGPISITIDAEEPISVC